MLSKQCDLACGTSEGDRAELPPVAEVGVSLSGTVSILVALFTACGAMVRKFRCNPRGLAFF
jgi:hypothetical protein